MSTVLENVTGVYSIIIGVSIIVLWTMLALSKKIPELKTTPIEIYFHVSAELLMGTLALVSGLLLLLDILWGNYLFLISSGLCIYSVINSSGYYAQRKNWIFVSLFTIILLASSILSILMIVFLIKPI